MYCYQLIPNSSYYLEYICLEQVLVNVLIHTFLIPAVYSLVLTITGCIFFLENAIKSFQLLVFLINGFTALIARVFINFWFLDI